MKGGDVKEIALAIILVSMLAACAPKQTYWQLPPGVDFSQAERDEAECKKEAAMVNQAPWYWSHGIEEYREELVHKCMRSKGYSRE
jgi:hypothetical protein